MRWTTFGIADRCTRDIQTMTTVRTGTARGDLPDLTGVTAVVENTVLRAGAGRVAMVILATFRGPSHLATPMARIITDVVHAPVCTRTDARHRTNDLSWRP